MKIKKNGKTINLTESDIKILSKRLLKESWDTLDLEEKVKENREEIMSLWSELNGMREGGKVYKP